MPSRCSKQIRNDSNQSMKHEFHVIAAQNTSSTHQSNVNNSIDATTTVTPITTNAIVMAETKRDDNNPLVFNVREVPTEVRGVFHKSTGDINYTALIEFVKNISSANDGNLRK